MPVSQLLYVTDGAIDHDPTQTPADGLGQEETPGDCAGRSGGGLDDQDLAGQGLFQAPQDSKEVIQFRRPYRPRHSDHLDASPVALFPTCAATIGDVVAGTDRSVHQAQSGVSEILAAIVLPGQEGLVGVAECCRVDCQQLADE